MKSLETTSKSEAYSVSSVLQAEVQVVNRMHLQLDTTKQRSIEVELRGEQLPDCARLTTLNIKAQLHVCAKPVKT
jgi:NMD protein affecting ribosome stability and mRNA decay